MNHNITEEKLIGFLYGEISDEDRREVEAYLKDNPAKQQEMEEIGRIRTFMAKYQDEEDITKPEIYPRKDEYKNHKFKYWAVAATIAFLMTFGWSIYNMNFDKPVGIQQAQVPDKSKVEELIYQQEQLAITNDALIDKITQLEHLIQKINEDQQNQKTLIAGLQKQENSGDEQVDKYLVALQEQNKIILNEFLSTAQTAHKEQLQTILIDFADYMNEQREQDLRFLQARIQNLEHNTGEFQQATAELMANLTNSDIQFQN